MFNRQTYDKFAKETAFYQLFSREEEKRAVVDVDGIQLTYNNIPGDLQKKIWVNKGFELAITLATLGKVQLEKVVNTYTVGNMTKIRSNGFANVNNFYDPFSRFKDSWFDVCLVFDGEKAREFMLKDPKGDPADLENINIEAPIQIAHSDQVIIYSTTIEGLAIPHWISQLNKIHFNEVNKMTTQIVKDETGKEWLRLSRYFETHAALTDIFTTKMDPEKSIRVLVGLPTADIYRYVDAWHPVTFKGVGYARYYDFGDIKFWPVVYYNTSQFTDKEGRSVDNWFQAKDDLETMFKTLTITRL